MAKFRFLTAALLAIVPSFQASPVSLDRRAVIAYNDIVGFPETVPDGLAGTLYLKYKPFLDVYNGCVPYAAVNAAGDTGGGLPTSGSQNSGCDHNIGQVYGRAGAYNGYYAIMYSWYMPKDTPSPGLGHRHDWENIVVWLSEESETATVRGVAISAHGKYQKETSPSMSGNGPNIGYISIWPLDHQLIGTGTKGGQQPLIAWESMTDAARSAIENTDFGSATPSFRDNNFQNYLADALI